MQEGYQRNKKQAQITLQSLTMWHDALNELYDQNINLRMKYPTEPMKFYQTEEEIDDILSNLQEITQEHIPIIIESKIMLSVLKILNHPNSDINMQCIQFLHDIVAEEPTDDAIFEMYYRMCIWLIENGLFQCLTDTILKMNEEESVEQYQIALKILKMIQSLLQLWDQAVQILSKDTKILEYLANRIMPNYIVKHKVLDDNKYVSSDILVTILSNSLKAQQKFHTLYGMEILIESIRPYLSKAVTNNDEQQYLGNLFSCLNILLINPSIQLTKSRHIYHKMKGNQIMLQFIKAKNQHSVLALKSIAGSFTSCQLEDEMKIIEELIDFGGLKYIFPIILRQGIKGQDVDEQKTIDQNCLQIVYIMIRSTSEIYKMRVQAKLAEKRFAKFQKIFEIRGEYMQNIGKQLQNQIQSDVYLEKLKEGLGIVQTIDKIISSLIQSTSTIKQKIVVFMRLYGVSGKQVENNLKNHYKFIGDNPQKFQVERLISNNLQILNHLFYNKDS